ncbi:OmpA family protein [Clostridium sp. AL.422]|uniref:OmpA/MotB family protein n=1 Tax=Clostridium TaxID=1485 RepID=UPI00293DB18D|nr:MULTISPECIES: OmpA family protein [unclassified Clostridium]MDV4149695.1 OmpA family protein [Clostridium sp. AL.422]
MARKKKNKSEGLRGDEWMATYADTVTLLLTFFVLLYSMATVDSEKTKSISNAFTSMMSGDSGDSIMQYNLYNGEVPLIGGENEEAIDGGKELTEGEKLYNSIKSFVVQNDLQDVVEIIDDERGVAMQLRDNILFETSSSDLREESKDILRKLSTIISKMDNPVLIEGHTDNRAIKTSRFPSNWELSADRAVNVVRYFVEIMGQDPRRFSAIGYGEFKPVASNDTYEDMAKNRRVDILIVTADKEEN